MLKIFTKVALSFLLLFSLMELSYGQTLMPIPSQGSSFSGNVRGYWFTAPTNFTITGLKIPASVGTGLQSIHVMKVNDPTVALYPTESTNFTTLFYTNSGTNNTVIPVSIVVAAGDIIGILGQAGTTTGYSSVVSPYSTNINGLPVTLNRFISQNSITSNPAPNYSSEGSGGSLGLIEMYYTTQACSGQPSAGTVPASLGVCPVTSFSISATGATAASGMTNQWQQRVPAGTGSWVNVPGATASSYTVVGGISVPTDYRFTTMCNSSGLVDTSSVLAVTINPGSACVCTPIYTSGCTIGATINNVNTTGAATNITNNGSGCSSNNALGYTDFSATHQAAAMQTASFTINVGVTNYSGGVKVWIDYNQNGIFETTEIVTQSAGIITSGSTHTATITVPVTALAGETRMRVRVVESSTTFDACSSYTYGESEDYKFTVIGAAVCSGIPEAGSISPASQAVCASIPFTLNASGMTLASGLTFQWQSSTDGGTTWSNIIGANGTSLNMPSGITVATSYRMYVVCANGNTSDTTNVAAYTIKPVSQCYCTPTSTSTTYGITNLTTTGGIANINNTSAGGQGYVDNTAQVVSQLQGSSVNFSYSVVPTEGVGIWIDWNQNGSFLDAGEQVYNAGTYVSNGTGSIAVALSQPAGDYRMRIVGNYLSTSPIPCGDLGYASYGEAEDYTFTVIGLALCTGTPAPGNTLSSVSPACANANFTLSLANANLGTGITYQWESADDAAFTTNFTNLGTSFTQTTSQTSDKYYRCLVTCTATGLSAYSNPLLVTTNTNTCQCVTYCAATNQGSACITNVTFNSLNNTTACAPAPNYYSYESATTSVFKGSTYNFTVNCDAAAITSVWFDWNQNGILEPSEWSQPYTSATTGTISITVPLTALDGTVRMRVRSRLSGNPNGSGDACTALGSGETEDYCITVISPTPCSGTPEAGNISPASQSICAAIPFTVSATGSTLAGGLTFQWQNSTDGGATWSNISGANNTSYTVASGISVATSYRMYVVCSNGGASDTTAVAAYTITPANQCYCDPSGPGGSYSISNVTISGALTNFNNSSTNAPGGYMDYSSTISCTQAQGGSVNFSVTGAPSGSTFGWGIWVDWNQNGSFNDAGEQVYANNTYSNSGSGSFIVPATALNGTTKMRVGMDWLNTAPTACGPGNAYSEYEDYAFNTCPIVVPTASSVNVSYCGNIDGTISLSGLDANTTYSVGMTLGSTPLAAVSATTDASGVLTVNNLAVGSYTDIIATAPGGCKTTAVTATINEGPLPAVASGVNSTACSGSPANGAIVIHGLQTGNTYDVAFVSNFINDTVTNLTTIGDSIVLTDLVSGTYSDIVVYSAVCTSATLASVTITEPVKPLIAAAANNPNTNCAAPNGDILISSAQFSDLESYTVWYNGTAQGSFMPSGSIITVGGLAGGAYTDIHVITADGCPSDTVASVDVIGASSPALITDVVPIDDLSCGSNVEIRLVGAFPPTADVYYMFNETVASAFGGANPTGDTMIIFSLPSGVYSDFQINDAGCLSNVFDTTLNLYSGVPDSVIASSTSSGGDIQGAPVGVYYSNTACELIANIESTDSLGNVTVDVNVGAAAVFTGTMDPEPYVGRYYSIHADENNGGTVTLYFDQADLDSYNTLASGMGFPEILSANGYADLRITAFHSLPGSGNGVLNYDTATAELITPSVVWNPTYNRLEVTFTVTQFSGFFAHSTLNNMPLPVVMGNIKATNLGATNRVDWDTKDEQAGDRFVIERSADARSFTAIGNTDAKGIAGSKYSFIDAEPYTGINYYRLQILGNDGSQYYSKVVHASVAGEGLTLTAFPNPVSDVLTVKAQGNVAGKGALLLMDASGRVIAKSGIESNGTATFDMQHLAQGMYVIKFADDKGSQLIKVTKK